MGEEHVTVKLSLSPLPGGRFRSRVEESPAGANRDCGADFALPVPPEGGYSSFITQVGDRDRPETELEKHGRDLYDAVFSGSTRAAFDAARSWAASRDAFLRIAISALSPELVRVPWEFLHDGNGYLMQSPNTHVVRVLDQLPQEIAPFRPFSSLLVVVANPRPTDKIKVQQFDAEGHISRVNQLVEKMGAQSVELTAATARKLRDVIDNKQFDAIYFLGHGSDQEGGSGGAILLENSIGMGEWLSADRLAQWLAASDKQIYFAYLNSCKTGLVEQPNTFSGVAQRLLRDGQIPAIIAQQAPVENDEAMDVAEQFLKRVRRGDSPERAIKVARSDARSPGGWGIPIIYTHIRGTEEFERNRIACLLEADRNTRFELHLAAFRVGVPENQYRDDIKLTGVAEDVFTYKGTSHPRTAVMAAWDVLGLLLRIVPRNQIEIVRADTETRGEATHQFFFGTRNCQAVMRTHNAKFRFSNESRWVLEDTEYSKTYTVPDFTKLTPQQYDEAPDYGIVEKMVDTVANPKRVYFVIAGLGDRATRGGALYLREHWSEILKTHSQGSFSILLELPPGMREFHQMRRIDRKTGEPIPASSV